VLSAEVGLSVSLVAVFLPVQLKLSGQYFLLLKKVELQKDAEISVLIPLGSMCC
jgi:hypothetical protein